MSKFVQLRNGLNFPILGFGTYKLQGEEVYRVVKTAISMGYRAIDTATGYKNEEDIGRAIQDMIKENQITRQEIFVTSKISPREQGFERGYQAIQDSLKRLKTEYIDCMLIHWPGVQKMALSDPENKNLRIGSYKALEKAYNEGIIKSFGVSNYTERHLQEIYTYATIPPMVLQMELHPLYCPSWVTRIQKEMELVVTSYSTLGEGRFVNGEIELKSVHEISFRLNLSVALVLIRWAIQKGFTIIPKSATESRLKDNMRVLDFRLSEEVNYSYSFFIQVLFISFCR